MSFKRTRDRFAKLLGSNIRRVRIVCGLTAAELAKLARYHVIQLSNVERGLAVPGADALHRIAQALGVTMDALSRQMSAQSRKRKA